MISLPPASDGKTVNGSNELLNPQQMAACDRATIAVGVAGPVLMRRAAEAVFIAALKMRRGLKPIAVLCGPGNNGGDGYVVARLLLDASIGVNVFSNWAIDQLSGDAYWAASLYPKETKPLSALEPHEHCLVVDALFGAGLARDLAGSLITLIEFINKCDTPVLAVDLPSGIDGHTGAVRGAALFAQTSVTFCRKKPGHLLMPGRARCGRVLVADIGISDRVVAENSGALWENTPQLWRAALPDPSPGAHKYQRGAVAVCAGNPVSTGAARLAALAALKAGAGLSTVFAPEACVGPLSNHLTAVMVSLVTTDQDLMDDLERRKCRVVVIGPGHGMSDALRVRVSALLGTDLALVLDADALSAFADAPSTLLTRLNSRSVPAVLTPHEGEFRRLFPDLIELPDKVGRARLAAERSNSVIVLKGADTVIAEPDGRAAINATGGPQLATAGSGDVLGGMVAARLGSGMPAFEAACAAVYQHGIAGEAMGDKGTAEDLLLYLSDV